MDVNYYRSNFDQICHQLNSLDSASYAERSRYLENLHLVFDAMIRSSEDDVTQRFGDVNGLSLSAICSCLTDLRESCRELAAKMLTNIVKVLSVSDGFVSGVVPVVTNRLVNADTSLVEQSEEVRLSLIVLIKSIICRRSLNLDDYIPDLVRIVASALLDNCSNVKKESCRCIVELSSSASKHFRLHCDSLIEPLLLTLAYKHSQVRAECVRALGSIVIRGGSRYIDIIFPHLSRRLLLDNSPLIRRLVIEEVGNWALHLPDRGCHFPRLISLLLTSAADGVLENKIRAEFIWFQVGEQYVKDNKNDLLKYTEYQTPLPIGYPDKVNRPPAGCRLLVTSHLSCILPAVMTDLCDWEEAVRVKAAQLLFKLVWNAEDGITQHVPVIIDGLIKGCKGTAPQIIVEMTKSAELMSYFVPGHLLCQVIGEKLHDSHSSEELHIFSAMLHCCSTWTSDLIPHLQTIASNLGQLMSDQHHLVNCQRATLACLDQMLIHCTCKTLAFTVFQALIAISAFCKEDDVREHLNETFSVLTHVSGLQTKAELCGLFSKDFMKCIVSTPLNCWTEHSYQWLLFTAFICEGVGSKDVLVYACPILKDLLTCGKPEIFMFFILKVTSKLFEFFKTDEELSDYSLPIIRDCLLKNLAWHPGKCASVLRVATLLCLLKLLKSTKICDNKFVTVFDSICSPLHDSLSDDSPDVVIVSCDILDHLFNYYQSLFRPYNVVAFSSALLRKVDDSNRDVRLRVCDCLASYVKSWKVQQACDYSQIANIFEGLLLYLDDPDIEMQEAVLCILKDISGFDIDHAKLLVAEHQRKHTNSSSIVQLAKLLKSAVLH